MDDDNEKRFDRALENLNKITFASVLLAMPVFVLVALRAPAWIGIGYALVMGCVLAVMVVRGLRRTYGKKGAVGADPTHLTAARCEPVGHHALVTNAGRSFWKGCSVCGPHWFHRWWCPELRRTLDFVSVGFTVGAIIIRLARGDLNWVVAVPIVVGFWIATILVHIAQRQRSRGGTTN